MKSPMLGLRTAGYRVPDLEAAKEWYCKAFHVKPYFDEPYYVGFNIGGFELGLNPDGYVPPKSDSNGVAYWGVEDIEKEYQRLIELGASSKESPQDVGGEIKVATVADPWGNLIGLIYNPHFSLD
ncbi:MAG: VOC family protein [Saprospiraceae bacterium]